MAARPSYRGSVRQSGARLSLCMITRDEAKNLPACLRSVRGEVDEIVVADTGSSDRTVQIAEESGARIARAPWKGDFASARNAALGLCTGDWVLQLDADEELRSEDRPLLRETLASTDAQGLLVTLVSETRNGEALTQAVSRAVRLFRRLPGIAYRGMVHESVADSIVEAGGAIGQSELVIVHKGYACGDDDLRRKKERNLEILTEQNRRHPGDLHTLLKLTETCVSLERIEEAEEFLRLSFAALPTAGKASRPRIAHLFIIDAQLGIRKRDWVRAERSLLRSIEKAPSQNLGRWLMSHLKEQQGEFRQATEWLTGIVPLAARTTEMETSLEVDVEYPPADLAYRMGTLSRKAGDDEAAEAQFRRALESAPAHLPSILSISALWISHGDFERALGQMDLALRIAPGDRRLQAFRGRILQSLSGGTHNSEAPRGI